MPKRTFTVPIKGVPIDSTGKPQRGTVTIDPNHDPPLMIIRRSHGKRTFTAQLNVVASKEAQGQIIAEAAVPRRHKIRVKRGLV